MYIHNFTTEVAARMCMGPVSWIAHHCTNLAPRRSKLQRLSSSDTRSSSPLFKNRSTSFHQQYIRYYAAQVTLLYCTEYGLLPHAWAYLDRNRLWYTHTPLYCRKLVLTNLHFSTVQHNGLGWSMYNAFLVKSTLLLHNVYPDPCTLKYCSYSWVYTLLKMGRYYSTPMCHYWNMSVK